MLTDLLQTLSMRFWLGTGLICIYFVRMIYPYSRFGDAGGFSADEVVALLAS